MNETNFWSSTRTVRAWFYLISPEESRPSQTLADQFKPMDFIDKSIPFFFLVILLEFILSPLTGTRIRLNDVSTSITSASYSQGVAQNKNFSHLSLL